MLILPRPFYYCQQWWCFHVQGTYEISSKPHCCVCRLSAGCRVYFSLSFPSTCSLSLCLRLRHHSLAPYLSLPRSAAGRDPVAARLLMDATCERHTSCRMYRFTHFIYPSSEPALVCSSYSFSSYLSVPQMRPLKERDRVAAGSDVKDTLACNIVSFPCEPDPFVFLPQPTSCFTRSPMWSWNSNKFFIYKWINKQILNNPTHIYNIQGLCLHTETWLANQEFNNCINIAYVNGVFLNVNVTLKAEDRDTRLSLYTLTLLDSWALSWQKKVKLQTDSGLIFIYTLRLRVQLTTRMWVN